MKILYVTATPLEYSSSANMRNVALINGLVEQGHEVSTLSSAIEENSKYIDNTLVNVELKRRYWIENSKIHERMTKKDITKTSTLKNKMKNAIVKYAYMIYSKTRIYDSRKALVKKISGDIIQEEFDLMISSSDPKSAHLIAKRLIEKKPNITKKWIQYWGDPFQGDINKKTWVPEAFIQKEEKKLIKSCDYVVYVSPFTLKSQRETYKQYEDKMRFFPIPYHKEIIYNKSPEENIRLGYYGDYKSSDRNILPLYNAVKDMKIQLNICGYSDIELAQTDEITIKPRQQLSVIRGEEANTDLLVCICNKKGTQIPGKVYHYAATNKPILIILDGEKEEELREYFGQFHRYFLCSNNSEAIKKAINDYINKKEKDYLPCEAFKPETIANQFIQIVEK